MSVGMKPFGGTRAYGIMHGRIDLVVSLRAISRCSRDGSFYVLQFSDQSEHFWHTGNDV